MYYFYLANYNYPGAEWTRWKITWKPLNCACAFLPMDTLTSWTLKEKET